MKTITVAEVVRATEGELICGNAETQILTVSTDSRKLEPGSLFVPLVGENFDGHDFIEKALEDGAAAVLAAKDTNQGTCPVIRVDDTLRALQKLAAYYRSLFPIPAVALTGSVGKTTTKEMVAAVLESKFNTLKTEGNFNNEIGLPLTVFRLEKRHEIAVVEMGMSGFGEIDRLAEIIKPDTAILTNIGMSHIELLGSQENIYRAKSEILAHTKPNGTVLLNGDDPILWKHRLEIPQNTISAGVENTDCDVLASQVSGQVDGVSFHFSGLGHEMDITLHIPGEHNVYNALFACVCGILYGVPDDGIISALAEFRPANMRMDILEHDGLRIINDCYNAAPASMQAALKVLGAYPGRRVAVLGDIVCLGDYAYSAHREVGSAVCRCGIDELITVGENARYIAESAFENGMDSAAIHSFETVAELLQKLGGLVRGGDTILVKASRAMKLERVTEFLMNLV